MSNSYYTQTGAPAAQSRGASLSIRSEFGLVQTGFDAVSAAIALKGTISGQAWTGSHDYTGAVLTMATQTAGDNTTKGATTAFVAAAIALINSSLTGYAPLASPALSGTPTAPTAALGTNTGQIATMAALINQAFLSALPAQSAATIGQVPVSDGTNAAWGDVSVTGSDIYLYNTYGG
jgi:hypothetical protein